MRDEQLQIQECRGNGTDRTHSGIGGEESVSSCLLQTNSDMLPTPLSSNANFPSRGNVNVVKKRDGFIYTLVTIDNIEGQRLGLGIKHCQDQVIVSKSEKGSICASRLKVLDHIVDVNGTPVIDRDICRDMLIKFMQVDTKCCISKNESHDCHGMNTSRMILQDSNKVTLLVERPVSSKAIAIMKDLLENKRPPSLPPSLHAAVAPQDDRQNSSNSMQLKNPEDKLHMKNKGSANNLPAHANKVLPMKAVVDNKQIVAKKKNIAQNLTSPSVSKRKAKQFKERSGNLISVRFLLISLMQFGFI
ncbi:hypothetical protein DICVIV_08148 [Dictyocaulus viviparus]|uniref:PDZ domain-containing protein n=1 Tax=Dictyocaulus viviparus TaxID=29172 RepID=A0A0D8XPT4_DICVI|nr:hypothetical protein DICVIV_08148 [Dictyocaulus viviparus]